MCTHCGCSAEKASLTDLHTLEQSTFSVAADPTTVKMQHALLSGNDEIAAQNRQLFARQEITCINLMGTPGAGKTRLLEALLQSGIEQFAGLRVFEGDQESANDAKRIVQAGGKALQINTGVGCHLDAEMIKQGLSRFEHFHRAPLVVENVGNLVCPALFDLGETLRIAMMAVTDGDDKPVKYPHIFSQCDLVIINKVDLLAHVDFDMHKVRHDLSHLNPKAEVIELSAKTGEGLPQLVDWLDARGAHG